MPRRPRAGRTSRRPARACEHEPGRTPGYQEPQSTMSHTPPGSRLLAALLAASVSPALALGLAADPHSALGEPLDLVITITAGPEDSLSADCFYLPRPLPGGLPTVTRAQFTIESGSKLHVRTPQPLNEPAMVLRMHASCPGGGLVAREYPLLLDPRPVSAVAPPVVAPVQAPRAAAAKSPADAGAPGLRSIAGDTLAGLAGAVYPRNRRARDAYVAALREANPSLAGPRPDEPIPPETAVTLPDLRSVAGLARCRGPPPARHPPRSRRRPRQRRSAKGPLPKAPPPRGNASDRRRARTKPPAGRTVSSCACRPARWISPAAATSTTARARNCASASRSSMPTTRSPRCCRCATACGSSKPGRGDAAAPSGSMPVAPGATPPATLPKPPVPEATRTSRDAAACASESRRNAADRRATESRACARRASAGQAGLAAKPSRPRHRHRCRRSRCRPGGSSPWLPRDSPCSPSS